MNTTVQDAVERQLVIPVNRQRVWDALTSPEKIGTWFCDRATATLEPGAPMTFTWQDYGTTRGQVVTVDPPRRFAYRWVPFQDSDHSIPFAEMSTTLVEFTLEEMSEGTRVTVLESGFAALPADMREQRVQEHSEGWIAKTTCLLDYLVAESGSR